MRTHCTLYSGHATCIVCCAEQSLAAITVRDTKTESYGMRHAASQIFAHEMLTTGRGEALASLRHAYLGSFFLDPE